MRHDVGEVVAAARLQVDVVDLRRPARWPRRCGRGPARGGRSTLRSTPRAAARRLGLGPAPMSPAASSAARIRCAPRLSPRTTHAQPNPLTMSSASSGSCAALQASAASMLARSARAKERCSAWRLLRTPCVEDAAASANHAACAARARSVSPASAIASSANAADAVEQPVANGRRRVVVVDDDERTAREPTDHVDRRGCRHVERLEDELDRREGSAASERGQRPQTPLVVGEQQLVAPPDRRPECSAAFRLAGWSGRSTR